MKQKLLLLKKYSNRYVLTGLLALVWMLFLDRYDLISQLKMRSELNNLEQDIQFYNQEIERVNHERKIFRENHVAVEKFAREHYLMKKDNEDLFVIVPGK